MTKVEVPALDCPSRVALPPRVFRNGNWSRYVLQSVSPATTRSSPEVLMWEVVPTYWKPSHKSETQPRRVTLGAKARHSSSWYGTAEAVPFQNPIYEIASSYQAGASRRIAPEPADGS